MLRTRLVQATGGRNTVDTRMRAAAHLLLAALADLGGVTVTDIASELERRELVLVVRSIESIVLDLVERLASLDRGELVTPDRCAHCGWHDASEAAGCFRCSKLRGVHRERRPKIIRIAEQHRRRLRG